MKLVVSTQRGRNTSKIEIYSKLICWKANRDMRDDGDERVDFTKKEEKSPNLIGVKTNLKKRKRKKL